MGTFSELLTQLPAGMWRYCSTPQKEQIIDRWEPLLDALPQLVCLIDANGQVQHANRTLERWGLGTVALIRGIPVHDMLHPGCRDSQCSLQVNWMRTWHQHRHSEGGELECRYESQGRSLLMRLGNRGQSRNGDIAENGALTLLVIEDVTGQKRATHPLQDDKARLENLVRERTRQLALANARLRDEIDGRVRERQSLAEAEKKYSCLLDTTLTGFYIIEEGRIVFCNRRFAEIFGYTQEAILSLDMQHLFPMDMTTEISVTNKRPDTTGVAHIARGIRQDGETLWLHRSLARLDCLSTTMTLGNIIDVTAQRKAEMALECMLCDKKRLSKKILITQESERKQIAGELHDSIGQSISAIKFSLENMLHDYGGGLQDPVRESLSGAVVKLRDTVEEVRRISMNLRPSMLDDLGLLATLSWFSREFRALFPGLDIEVRIDVAEDGIPAALKIVIFRILQEALNNIIKHADAGRVVVRLEREGDRLSFSVADNGCGFSTESMEVKSGFGLGSMRERASLSGGRLEIRSTPGSGTLVCVVWQCGQ